jgi:hypothetical protein
MTWSARNIVKAAQAVSADLGLRDHMPIGPAAWWRAGSSLGSLKLQPSRVGHDNIKTPRQRLALGGSTGEAANQGRWPGTKSARRERQISHFLRAEMPRMKSPELAISNWQLADGNF